VSVQLKIARIVADREFTTTVDLSVIMSSRMLFEIRPRLDALYPEQGLMLERGSAIL
jgi:hypothetical protein